MPKAQARKNEDGTWEVRFPEIKTVVHSVPGASANEAVSAAADRVFTRGPVKAFAKGFASTAPTQMAGAVDWLTKKAAKFAPYMQSMPMGLSFREPPPRPTPEEIEQFQPTAASDWMAEKQQRYLPGLQKPSAGPVERVAEAAGGGLAWGLPFAPMAAAAGAPALGLELAATTGAPALGQIEREMGAPEAVATGTEFVAGVTPAAVVRTGVSRAGRTAAMEALEGAATRTLGHAPEAADVVGAVRRVQSDVGGPLARERLEAATRQAVEDFPEGSRPLTYQVAAGAEPEVPGAMLGHRTRQMLGNEEWAQEAGERVQRARDYVTERRTELRPAETGTPTPERFRAEGEVQMGKAREAYEKIPPVEEQAAAPALNEIVAEFDDLANGGTIANQVIMEEYFGKEQKMLQKLIDKYGDAEMIPVQELDDLLSSVSATLRANKDTVSYVGRRLQAKIKEVMQISEERAAAKAKWRETKQTFEPEAPKRGKRGTEKQRAEYATAQALGGPVSGVARRIVKPTAGVSGRTVAKQAKKIFGHDPEAMAQLKSEFAEEIFGDPKKVPSPNVFAQNLRNRKIRGPYEILFGADDWPQFEALARMRNQAEYSQLARQGETLIPGSGTQMQSAAELASLTLRAKTGDIGAIARLGAKVLRGRFSDSDTAKLFRAAFLDPEIMNAMLRVGTLGPEEWAEYVSTVAARRGVQIGGKEALE